MKVFKTVGVELTEDQCKETTGFRFDEVVDYWYQRKPWKGKTHEQIAEEVIEEMEYSITNKAVEMAGVHASLEFFKSKGLKMAVASSSAMRLIKATVKKLEIAPYFEMLFSAEHEKYGKPNPGIFLTTAEKLGFRPDKCLVIEDSLNGVLAAKSAKMSCAAIPDPLHFNDSRFVIVDYKFNNLGEMVEYFGK